MANCSGASAMTLRTISAAMQRMSLACAGGRAPIHVLHAASTIVQALAIPQHATQHHCMNMVYHMPHMSPGVHRMATSVASGVPDSSKHDHTPHSQKQCSIRQLPWCHDLVQTCLTTSSKRRKYQHTKLSASRRSPPSPKSSCFVQERQCAHARNYSQTAGKPTVCAHEQPGSK